MNRLFVLVALATLGAGTPPRLTITSTQFFAEQVDVGMTVEIERTETTIIPYVPGTSCYRWTINVTPMKGIRAVQERFTLPAPAKTWGGVDGYLESPTRVAKPRDAAITDLLVPLEKGVISNGWCVADGDPQGRYKIEVYDGKRMLHQFRFIVGAEPDLSVPSQ